MVNRVKRLEVKNPVIGQMLPISEIHWVRAMGCTNHIISVSIPFRRDQANFPSPYFNAFVRPFHNAKYEMNCVAVHILDSG